MSEEKGERWHRALQLLGPMLIGGALCAGAGSMLTSHYDDQAAAKLVLLTDKDRERERRAATEREDRLKQTIDHEREDRATAIRQRDDHLAAFTRSTVRVRNDIEAQLSAARSDGQACTARVAGIADSLGGIFDAVGEVADLAQELDQQNGRLKAENRKLAGQVSGLIANYKENHPERVTVTGSRH